MRAGAPFSVLIDGAHRVLRARGVWLRAIAGGYAAGRLICSSDSPVKNAIMIVRVCETRLSIGRSLMDAAGSVRLRRRRLL